MKASLIISVYKNIPFLKTVLDSFRLQTEKDVEIVIAEDGENQEMLEFVSSYPFECPYTHVRQKDEGWQKNRILNKAIKAANGNWLIFIDGDCVMHERFIEMHLRHANPGHILAGKRVKLNAELSTGLMTGSISIPQMQFKLKKMLLGKKSGATFVEEGIFISPDGLFRFVPQKRKNKKLVGCNMSFSKEAIYAINGFDEDYTLPAFGEDRDLSWRFNGLGYTHTSLRNLAIVYHLQHPMSWSNQEENFKKYLKKKDKKEFICANGLQKLSFSE